MGRVIDEGDTLRVKTGYVPRPQAIDFHKRTERFACLVAHRRFGKTVASINDLIKACYTVPSKMSE